MIIAKVLIPGEFNDAYAYMGRLHVLTTERSMRSFNLESAAWRMEEAYSEFTPAATYLFARNDWFGNAPFVSLMQNDGLRQTFRGLLEGLAASAHDASEFFDVEGEIELDIHDARVLDFDFYGAMMYLATSRGLYDVAIDWDDVSALRAPQLRHDARCFHVSAAYGAVNASCGSEGLFSAWGELYRDRSIGVNAELHRLADRSVRTGWSRYDLVNYTSNSRMDLFETEQETEQVLGGRAGPKVVTGVETRWDDRWLFDSLREKHEVQEDNVQFVFNSRSRFFISTYDHRLFIMETRRRKAEAPTAGDVQAFRGIGGRTLEAVPTKLGVVVETDDQVLLFSQGEWTPLHDGPVLSVRAFPGSKRYRHLIAVTSEEGVWLISGVPDLYW